MHWYARNLRIFRNIQAIATEPDDRIMVIFGAGHLGILRQQLESYPGMELVEFSFDYHDRHVDFVRIISIERSKGAGKRSKTKS